VATNGYDVFIRLLSRGRTPRGRYWFDLAPKGPPRSHSRTFLAPSLVRRQARGRGPMTLGDSRGFR